MAGGLVGDPGVTPLVSWERLTLGYGTTPVLKAAHGGLVAGSLTAVVGPNGAGKSTLLKALVGLLRPLAGRIDWHGIRRQQLGWLPQQAALQFDFPITVAELASLGRWRRTGLWGALGGCGQQAVAAALAQVGLTALAQQEVVTLSGGQRQRLLFARLLLEEAPVLLLDEPFAALDSSTAADLLALLMQLHREGRTIIAVLHDLELVRSHFPETLLVADRQLLHGPTAQLLAPAALPMRAVQ